MLWRPLLLPQQFLCLLPQFLAHSAVSWLPVLVIHGIPLCGFPHILATASTVAPELTRYRRRIHTNCLGDGIFFSPFCSNTEIVYLCSEVSCLYISNANLTDFWETVVSLSFFLHCLLKRAFPWGLEVLSATLREASTPHGTFFFPHPIIALLSWTWAIIAHFCRLLLGFRDINRTFTVEITVEKRK